MDPSSWSQPQSPSRRIAVVCEICESTERESNEDGYYYCRGCGVIIPELHVTADAVEDICGVDGEGGMYSMRGKVQGESSQPSAAALPSREEILRSSTQTEEQWELKRERERELERTYGFEESLYQPRDFGCRGRPDPESLVNGIRLRYVQGMQLMVQLQCEALVQSHGVSPLVCGVVGGIWMRYVAATRVFDDNWANQAIDDSEEAFRVATGENDPNCKEPIRNKWEPHNLYGRRAIFIWFNYLKRAIPHHVSLAMVFLACHVARQPVLPTDIVKWALEAKLPYISAFTKIDTLLGSPSETCPLHSRTLFKPLIVIGPWELETTAGSIAESIGLRLPPVNFYAIASRYLVDLPLPYKQALSMACRVYEWSFPVELCLSKHPLKLPTRVYVMVILMVVTRVLYNIEGCGIWEKSLSSMCTPIPIRKETNVDCKGQDWTYEGSPHIRLSNPGNCKFDATNKNDGEKSMPVLGTSSPIEYSDDDTLQLLQNLEKMYEKKTDTTYYAKDFKAYLQYCKDIIAAGITRSCNEESLMEWFWNMYKDDADVLTGRTIGDGREE